MIYNFISLLLKSECIYAVDMIKSLKNSIKAILFRISEFRDDICCKEG